MSNFPSGTSDAQSGFFVTLLSNLFNIDNLNILTLIIRKTAHLFEYFVLGILVFCMLKSFNIKKLILFSGLTCILYSVSDEIHQMFVVGRSCELRDMLIDSLGSILGIIIINRTNVDTIDLLGWSWGTVTGTLAQEKCSEMIDKFVL